MLYKKQMFGSAGEQNPYKFLVGKMMPSGPGSQPWRATSGSNTFNPSNAGSIGRPTGSAPVFGGNHQSAMSNKLPMFSRGAK